MSQDHLLTSNLVQRQTVNGAKLGEGVLLRLTWLLISRQILGFKFVALGHSEEFIVVAFDPLQTSTPKLKAVFFHICRKTEEKRQKHINTNWEPAASIINPLNRRSEAVSD